MIKAHNYYNEPFIRETCHAAKERDRKSLDLIAQDLATRYVLTEQDILIPAPQHEGRADYTRYIAEKIREITGVRIADILRCVPHQGIYQQKLLGEKAGVTMYLDEGLPLGRLFFVDNVLATGTTFLSANTVCDHRLIPLVYAVDRSAP